MASFRDRPFEQRIGALGDMAEAEFETRWPTGYARTGLNRPPIKLSNVPAKYRFTPDYMVHDGWVEVMGYGRDQTLKCKKLKWDVLGDYDEEWNVRLFLWDSHNQQPHTYAYADMDKLLGSDYVSAGRFPEGHEYWGFDMKGIVEL